MNFMFALLTLSNAQSLPVKGEHCSSDGRCYGDLFCGIHEGNGVYRLVQDMSGKCYNHIDEWTNCEISMAPYSLDFCDQASGANCIDQSSVNNSHICLVSCAKDGTCVNRTGSNNVPLQCGVGLGDGSFAPKTDDGSYCWEALQLDQSCGGNFGFCDSNESLHCAYGKCSKVAACTKNSDCPRGTSCGNVNGDGTYTPAAGSAGFCLETVGRDGVCDHDTYCDVSSQLVCNDGYCGYHGGCSPTGACPAGLTCGSDNGNGTYNPAFDSSGACLKEGHRGSTCSNDQPCDITQGLICATDNQDGTYVPGFESTGTCLQTVRKHQACDMTSFCDLSKYIECISGICKNRESCDRYSECLPGSVCGKVDDDGIFTPSNGINGECISIASKGESCDLTTQFCDVGLKCFEERCVMTGRDPMGRNCTAGSCYGKDLECMNYDTSRGLVLGPVANGETGYCMKGDVELYQRCGLGTWCALDQELHCSRVGACRKRGFIGHPCKSDDTCDQGYCVDTATMDRAMFPDVDLPEDLSGKWCSSVDLNRISSAGTTVVRPAPWTVLALPSIIIAAVSLI